MNMAQSYEEPLTGDKVIIKFNVFIALLDQWTVRDKSPE